MKLRKGNKPEGPGWFFKSINVGPRKWTVCYKVVGAGVSWTEVKLVAETPSPYKGNFYMNWNGSRFAKSKDSGILETQHQELHEAAVKLLVSMDSEIFLAGAKGRAAPAALDKAEVRLATLLAKRDPELYAALLLEVAKEIKGVQEPESEEKPWINLGPVGVVANLERDLLVKTLSENDIEVRLSTSESGVPTDIFFCARREEDGLTLRGYLHDALRRNTPEVCNKVEELLAQYFIEKDFY